LADYRKKLIEVALPLEAINAASAREKSIRHGHPSTLHLWWARRPLAACRAVLFGQLVDDPSSWPERFATEEEQDRERQRLFRLIERMVPWEASKDEAVLNEARWEIARSVAWGRGEEPPADPKAVLAYLQETAPPVYDPFCGGGSIPLEAQRLGLRAYGSDLNPVAVLISKALVEIPPKFAGRPPVNPAARIELERGGAWQGKGAEGLAEDVRYYGQWMRNRAEKRIGHLYPRVEVTAEAVRQQPSLRPLQGQTLTVIAWLWARTVASPNPAAKGAMVPLASSFMLSTKDKKKAWVEPAVDPAAPDGYRFEVKSGALSKEREAELKAGTKSGRGANFTCVLTGTPITGDHIKAEGMAGRMGARLMAVVADGPKGRVYLPATAEHEETARSAEPEWEPEGSLPDDPRNFWTVHYGLKEFRDLFTRRQLVALTTFSDLVSEAREQVLEDARAAGLSEDTRLADGGTGAEAYADAVATYLGLVIGRQANRTSTLCFWDPGGANIQQVFARQALPMVWDFCESNPLGEKSGGFLGQFGYLTNSVAGTPAISSGQVKCFSAEGEIDLPTPWIVATDPPYYDNIGYADLSDFFYAWLRPSLKSILPDLFRTMQTPKSKELVASPYRHDGKERAERHFREGMKRAVSNMLAAESGYPITMFYAFKQAEKDVEGVTSTGWASFLESLVQSGLVIDGTWPMNTELAGNLKKRFNALASSIVLACRERPSDAPRVTRADFVQALRRELPDAVRVLQQGSIAPVDLTQAAFGPGMAVFSRYESVLEADDSPMSVKTALLLINAELDAIISGQDSEYDEWTRFAISWFENHGMNKGPYDDAEKIARARGVAVSGVVEAGLMISRGGSSRLFRREEMPADWDPATDDRLTVWECTHHLIRRLDEDGEAAAADLLNAIVAAPGRTFEPEAAKDLAFRLHHICSHKGWADEGLAYNGLGIVWPDLVRLAAEAGQGGGQAQSEMAV